MEVKRIIWTGTTALFLFGFASSLFAQFQHYKVTFITNFRGTDINDSTEIVGYYPSTGDPSGGGAKWKNGTLTPLPYLYDYSIPYRINNASQIVGYSFSKTPTWGYFKATYWSNSSSVIDLGVLPECNNSSAFAINSSGIICGSSWFDTGNGSNRLTPFIYNTGMTPYPVYDAMVDQMDINDNGWVIEVAEGDPIITYVLNGGTVIATLPGFRGSNINNINEVVGWRDDIRQPGYWSNGTLTTLTAPSETWASGINDSGTIIGNYFNRGVIWMHGQMQYLDSLVPPVYNIMGAYAINNKGEILCWGTTLQAFGTCLLIPDTANITKPREGDTWIAGEKDTIKWRDVWSGRDLLIEYSNDNGMSYQTLVVGVSGDSCKYVWDVPKDILSAKCQILISDMNTFEKLSESEIFKIKPYMITRLDTSGNYVAYDITTDRWKLDNSSDNDMWPSAWYNQFDYRGTDPYTSQPYSQVQGGGVFASAKSSDYTDWESFVNVFGKSACYSPAGIYNPTALLNWKAYKSGYGGSCFALAGSNAIAFQKKVEFLNRYPDFPNFTTPVSVTSNFGVVKSIANIFAHVYGNPTVAHETNNWSTKTPNQTLNELKEMLKTDNTKIRTLSFWDNTNSGAHCVLPYQIEQDDVSGNIWYIWIYDSNYPNSVTSVIVIDTSANGNKGFWNSADYPGWGGTGRIILELESSTYLGTPTLPKGLYQFSPFILGDTTLRIITAYNSDIEIKDQEGHVTGYADSILSCAIPGSVPWIPPVGKRIPPYGYYLHIGDYSITLDKSMKDTICAYFFTGNRIFSYERYGATEIQMDRLYFDGALVIKNPDADSKTINLLYLSDDTTDQKLTLIRSLNLAENDSVRFGYMDDERLKLSSVGNTKSYSLEIQKASDSSLARFIKSDIPLIMNTTHIIEPDWTDLDSSILIILVDEGNNGTIDDTLRLQNDLTDIHDHGSVIHGEYKLYQNYPNPFNPMTTIKYEIAKTSFVTLKVFNLLGQEVATLIDEKKEAGSYEVQFSAEGGSASGGDGSKLPSGVYFYRLQTEHYANTKKLILIK